MADRKYALLAWFVGLSAADAVSTWYLIDTGAWSEGNLFFKVFSESWYAMGAFKAACVAFVAFMVWNVKDSYEAQKLAFTANVVMLAVVGWNLSFFFR